MRYTLEIQKLVAQAESKSLAVKEKCKLYSQAIRIADGNEDVEWGYDLRLEYLHWLSFSSSNEEMVVNFSWILNAYEENPDLFDESDFLWMYKWVLSEMYSNPDVSLEQLKYILNDFKVRMQRNGYSLRTYYDRLYDECMQMNQFEKAYEYLCLRNAEPRDDMSNCNACELDNELDYYFASGQFDEAYNRAHPLLGKQLSCRCVPTRTFATLAQEALFAGKPDVAADMFARAEEGMLELQEDESMLCSVGAMTNYLFRTGSERAWEYVEKYLPWSLKADAYRTYMYAKKLAGGLKRVAREKKVGLRLPVDFPLYREDNSYQAGELFDYFLEKATGLAVRFDARNGNAAFSENVRKELQ